MLQKRWVVRENTKPDLVEKLSSSLNIDPVLAQLLVQRDITSFPEARDFFRPSLDNLHDPFLIKDMDVAIRRIELAMERGERILVYGDYDVDGTTAVTLVYSFLKDFYDKLEFYIPDRYKEGYGISHEGIDHAKRRGVSLMIALDCGIKAVEQVEYALERGIEFIVVDHHRPGEVLPPAVALIDPKQSDCNYPYKELSGCGLGFKLAQAFYQKHRKPFEELEKFLDLVVVSIAADIVPITGENRVLAHFGLKRLNMEPRAGLESILFYNNIFKKSQPDEKTAFTREININDLMFMIGPRINAAGRIENGKTAVDLLLCDHMGDTHQLSQTINENNAERRSLDTNITEQAMRMIRKNPRMKNSRATILYDPEWSKGVIGIVASRLIENYYRPTIILTESNGMITGSARSVKDFDIYDAIDACSHFLEHFGGHKYAAGLSLKPENLEAFTEAFHQVVEDTITEAMLVPEIEIDAQIGLPSIEGKFFRVLKQFAPFGPGNTNPVFLTRGCVAKNSPRVVGNKHLKFNLTQPEMGMAELPAIAFQQGHQLENMLAGKPFDLVYQIEENEWNGKTHLQLNVKDILFPEE
ncbi:MAG: single-stranded-DNA-specific exonuclease RecJ [Bacteroides sp.]|jgi:single-stranded-DNA-specific exonuclease|nr:single-stranded-DNA-specific exonuclease RecJ [Bacteroides sp.]